MGSEQVLREAAAGGDDGGAALAGRETIEQCGAVDRGQCGVHAKSYRRRAQQRSRVFSLPAGRGTLSHAGRDSPRNREISLVLPPLFLRL